MRSWLQVLKLDEDMKRLALQLKNESSLLIFGRGVNYATALEAALKVHCTPAPPPGRVGRSHEQRGAGSAAAAWPCLSTGLMLSAGKG